MTYDEFETEVMHSNCCPADFSKIYKEFRSFQEMAINTLKVFHEICEKHHIAYHLTYGSLLGAIRDGGQIPWDYDVDVYIHFEDRYELIHALEKDLSEDYYFTCAESKIKPEQYFIRIAPKDYSTDYMHVDVFYLIGMPADKVAFQNHNNEIKRLLDIYTKKNVSLKGSFQHRLKAMINKLRYLPVMNNSLIRKIDTACAKYNSYVSPLKVELYQTRDGYFYIPAGYAEFLSKRYGDYKSYPPIESRVQELLCSYNRLKMNLSKGHKASFFL